MQRWKLTLQYDGCRFHGWQSQSELVTVQETLETALAHLEGRGVRSHVAGRTDRGVHALAQVAHVDLARDLPPERMRLAIQAHLPKETLALTEARPVSRDFHARFSAVMRHYRYRILQTPYPPVLEHHRVCWVHRPLDVTAMQSAAEALIGHHDFSSFRAAGCQAKNARRSLERVAFSEKPYTQGREIVIEFSARSFLYHQVRNMVGTLLEIGEGRRGGQEMAHILAAKDRSAAGKTAPAEGLYFLAVDYP